MPEVISARADGCKPGRVEIAKPIAQSVVGKGGENKVKTRALKCEECGTSREVRRA